MCLAIQRLNELEQSFYPALLKRVQVVHYCNMFGEVKVEYIFTY